MNTILLVLRSTTVKDAASILLSYVGIGLLCFLLVLYAAAFGVVQ